jgi:hypothetical protein
MDPIPLKKIGYEWGPLLWNVFHSLAEWSDRRDIIYRWKRVMEITSVTIPCEVCRRHMQEYLRAHSIFMRPVEVVVKAIPRKRHGVVPPTIKGWIPAKGEEVKQAVRAGLWKFHNHVNQCIGAAELPEADAYALYQGPDRSTACKKAREEITAIESLWKSSSRTIEWIRELIGLLALIESGTY